MLIRERVERDLPALVEILWKTYESDAYPAVWPEDPAAWIASPRAPLAWVIEDDGVVIGHLAMARDLRDDGWRDYTDRPPSELIEVTRLFVAPEHRGHGAATALMQQAHEYAEANGLQAVLQVTEAERAAIAVYEALGWQQVDTRKAVWADATGGNPTLRWYVASSSLISF